MKLQRNWIGRYGVLLALAACSGGEAPATDDDAPAEPGAAEEVAAVGRCAVDPRDNMMYGKIVEEQVDATTGNTMYQIEGEGGASWNKIATNVNVVDCP